MRDRQEITDPVSSGEEEEDVVEAVDEQETQLNRPKTVASVSGIKKKKRKAAVEVEVESDESEEVIDLSSKSVVQPTKTKRPLRFTISENCCLVNYNPRYSKAKQYCLIRLHRTDPEHDFNFGIANAHMPALLSSLLMAFNKDVELLQHLKAEPKLHNIIKESFKDLMANLKA